MRRLLCIVFILPYLLMAQDKVFFKSGKTAFGTLVSLTTNDVFFLYKDSLETSILNKNEILLIEKANGERFLIGQAKKNSKPLRADTLSESVARNAFGLQPFGLFVGRITFAYERFLSTGKIGLMIPVSLTFDPFGVIYPATNDSSSGTPQHIPGIGLISGIDLNYYFKQGESSRYFMGPRIRYGTDKMLRGIEGYCLQFQLGLQLQNRRNLSQHMSVGYGFVKILNVPSSSTLNPEQLYGWLSLNYRISLLK
ncbi:MAG: hypothetical protein MUF75_07510 [Bacteroidia bacterium]|nr:hypothetical protein [Bacteroidia bacterium]